MKNSKTTTSTGWLSRVFKLGAQLGIVFTAVAAFSPSQASAETRTLKLHFVHTGERAEITYKKNGRFLPEGMKKLNVFLRDWRRNEPANMDPRLMDLVWNVYKTVGGRDYITVVSAYRSPATNSMLRGRTRGVAKNSQHTYSKALDFFIPGVPLKKIRDAALKFQVGGVGYYPTSGSPFVHLDVGGVRHWPRMSRKELLAVFPDGKTIHVPTDGKPLPGYQQAMAAYEARKANGGTIQMAAAAKPKSKTLFSALFGGGSDEEEDNIESTGRAAATNRPVRAAPAAPAVVPTPAVPNRAVPAQQETLIAALPAAAAPLPLAAPRPAEPVEMTADAQAAMAFAVPLPVTRPQAPAETQIAMAPPPANTLQAQAYAGATGAPSAPVADQIAALVDADNTPVLSGYVPVPARRPQNADQAINMMLASAAVPAARPEMAPVQNDAGVARREAGRDAIADLLSNNEKTAVIPLTNEAKPRPAQTAQTQVAMAAPQAMAEIISDAEGTARTTAKAGRTDRPTAKAASPAVVQPADTAPEAVTSNESVAKTVPATNPVLKNDAMRQAPTVVYTAGFQKDLPSGDANRFTGNAVTFMSIAKFSQTN